MRILVTGGAGFIGSNYVRHRLSLCSDDRIINLDKLTYAGNLENLCSIEEDPRYTFLRGDICDEAAVGDVISRMGVEGIVHFAAESHVDRSIEDAAVVVKTNIVGTHVLLSEAIRHGVRRFVHVSTDEVYGSLGPQGVFTEDSPLSPNNPYSTSKACSDLFALAAFRTYGLPVCVSRCSNNYGPYQFPEKFIPLVISNALENEGIPVYGTGENIRDWIHVEDHCRAIDAVLAYGVAGAVYNFGASAEKTNLEVARRILDILGKPESLLQFVSDRPGHDQRYAMGTEKAERELGWRPRIVFDEGLRTTVEWYLANMDWLRRVRNGAYRTYYERVYKRRSQWLGSASWKGQTKGQGHTG